MNKKDYQRTKIFLFNARDKFELQYALGYEDALNTFGLLTRKQHYELHDTVYDKILKHWGVV